MDLPRIVYLNGKVIDAADAKVSIFDYGFLFGAGVYDVALLYDGHLFQELVRSQKLSSCVNLSISSCNRYLDKPTGKEHLDRFFKSAASIGIPIKESKEEILTKIIPELVKKNDLKDGIVYLHATFGAYGKRSHKLPTDINEPTLVIFPQYLAPYPVSNFTEGVSVTTQVEYRWTRCDVKTTLLLPAVLAINQLPAGAAETVFFDAHSKFIRECAASNVFCVKNGTVYTPPLSKYILPGIERQTIVNIAKANNIPIKEEDFTLDFFLAADEVFMSSTTKEVLPIKQVDDVIIANTPGPVTRQLIRLFVEYVEKELSFVHPKRKTLNL